MTGDSPRNEAVIASTMVKLFFTLITDYFDVKSVTGQE